MALNVAVFKTRALTALIFVAVMLLGIFVNQYIFAALFFGILLGCVWEATKLYLIYIHNNQNIAYHFNAFLQIASHGGIFLMLGFFCFKELVLINTILILTLFIAVVICTIKFKHKMVSAKIQNSAQKNDGLFILGYTLLLPICFFALIHLRFSQGLAMACLVIFSMWINDTMAYLVGSFIGKTPLSKISPKKTWEGTIGGIILCALVMGFGMPLLFNFTIPSYHIFIIAAICGIVGTLGDLTESKIKRLANVKDSGTFMKGHGGFLDRFDSIIFGAAFVWLYCAIVL